MNEDVVLVKKEPQAPGRQAKIVREEAEPGCTMVQYADNSQQELVPKEHIFSLAAASTEGQANFHTATSDRNTENGVETCPEATKADDHEISFDGESAEHMDENESLSASFPSASEVVLQSAASSAIPVNSAYEAERAEFLHKLYRFMESIGQPILKTPFLGYQELDLYELYKIVTGKGGMEEVSRRQEWKIVYQELGIPTMSTSASYNTRTNYKKYLYLFELENFKPSVEKLKAASQFQIHFQHEVGSYVKLISSEGQPYYAMIVKRKFQNAKLYYIHYNGWSTSHDEWMPENVLQLLNDEERENPKNLQNPPPSRSSKSNYLVDDVITTEKHLHTKSKRAKAEISSDANSNSESEFGLPSIHTMATVLNTQKGRHEAGTDQQALLGNVHAAQREAFGASAPIDAVSSGDLETLSNGFHQLRRALRSDGTDRNAAMGYGSKQDRLTFKSFYDRFFASKKASNTISQYSAHFNQTEHTISRSEYRYLDTAFPDEAADVQKSIQTLQEVSKNFEANRKTFLNERQAKCNPQTTQIACATSLQTKDGRTLDDVYSNIRELMVKIRTRESAASSVSGSENDENDFSTDG